MANTEASPGNITDFGDFVKDKEEELDLEELGDNETRIQDKIIKTLIPIVLVEAGELISPIKVPKDLRIEEFYLYDFSLAKKISDLTT
ncbi:hypothetical protein N7449_011831 [Penicillium cf. viridicatum]|uniref:Uncharacterized protein n=1 Tax=Penicillium cf. viridicatum TaxID=2972119 RepID=A0A9W9IPK4_9EURO|nr:hypothetical protein N7449_011831 [Penicillium cf. viridicatum]